MSQQFCRFVLMCRGLFFCLYNAVLVRGNGKNIMCYFYFFHSISSSFWKLRKETKKLSYVAKLKRYCGKTAVHLWKQNDVYCWNLELSFGRVTRVFALCFRSQPFVGKSGLCLIKWQEKWVGSWACLSIPRKKQVLVCQESMMAPEQQHSRRWEFLLQEFKHYL